MIELLESNKKEANDGLPWWTCVVCGELTERGLVPFKTGSVVPALGETLTGATSLRTGIVADVTLKSGSWAGGDAAGVIQVTSPAGWDEIEQILFTNGETINGNSGGRIVADGDSSVNRAGRQYSRNQIVDYNGQRYCIPHFYWRYNHNFIRDTDINLPEELRGLWY